MGETVKTCSSCGGELPNDAAVCPSCGAELGKAARRAKKSWFPLWTRLGCLAALVLLCLIAAILIPSGLTSPKRTRQKAQMSQVRTFATLILSYETDFNQVPVPQGASPAAGWRFVTIAEIKPALVPTYGSDFPEKDVYGHPYVYGFTGADPEAFCVIGTGSDGRRDSEELPRAPVQTHCWENDVIWMNDAFLQVPEGPQSKCAKGFSL